MTRKAIIRLTNSALAITLVLITSCKKEETDPITQPAPSPTPITTASGAGVTDFDGNTYTTIVLGNGQEWMAENLRTTTYTNGDPVENILDPTNWQNATTGAWSHYDNDNQFENPYGKLYNWYAVDDNRNICPTDWHVPTAAEWDVLRTYLDPNGTMMDNVAGSKMKTTGNDYWLYGNTDATNQIGFSGLPGGLHFGNSTDMGELGYWWTATETDATTGELRYLVGTYTELLTYMEQKFIGKSVRCIKN